ncbi:TetR/AcrR family transcriptional regulator [Sulfuricurvum sp.]|uniref:TetR/AcrR family transcriptional regulator n=1 Tax=Sulfuricurvum sp. TaxID=2025608 RepID=UPI00260BFA09|nr:TetR/AcrR family transcriptional regulator [Sulfuricurvum sp.]MDD2266889.1 TetR/AcrR family transcriptional regulator [Sulfuricurvum sp.]MDD2784378.1 TetR/AcrR family transcriptional regulator [Sulfuricurvum sp.]HZF69455.1 TetR/AcrR family transcriptional regulator [Sulfuricurvum sp.]
MKDKKNSPYHHGNLKEELLQTALEMIDKEGLDTITLRELTQRLGTSRTAVYRHFASKEALILGVIEKGYEHLNLLFTPIFEDRTYSVAERFERMGRAYLNFAIEHPNLYRLLFGEMYRKEREEICDYKDETQATGLYALIGLLSEAQEEGIIAQVNPLIQAAMVWASIHGLASLLIDGHLMMSDNMEAIYEYSIGVLLKGLQ